MADDVGIAWLVEQGNPVTKGVIGSFLCAKDGYFLFTDKANEALRFKRREDAENFIAAHFTMIRQTQVLATEHLWLAD